VLKQTVQVVFDGKYSHKGTISFLTLFEKAISAAVVIDPSEASLNFPTLPTIALLVFILWRSPLWHRHVIRTIRGIGNDPAFSQLLPERLTVRAFIETQPLWTVAPVTDLDASSRFQDVPLVIPVGFAQSEIERIALGVNHQVAFEPVNTVFSRIPYLIFAPFFDFTTLASW